MNITILGAGTWGTALAKTFCEAGHNVKLWSIIKEEIEEMKLSHEHKNLPGAILPDKICLTDSLEEAMELAELVVIATPSIYVRSTTELIKPLLREGQIIGCVSKGLEEGTVYTMSEIIEDVTEAAYPVVAISGPTHAEEVAINIPTAIVCACKNHEIAKIVQHAFIGTCIRPYTNTDIKGVELCGALKNIMALACGITQGLGCGDNTKAALITRGIAEMTRLGVAMGCDERTFAGLAGIGDLIVTATSMHSRNNRAGILIGKGVTPEEAVKEVGMVVEGINAVPGAVEMAERCYVVMPIVEAVNQVVNGGKPVREVFGALLNRSLKPEN